MRRRFGALVAVAAVLASVAVLPSARAADYSDADYLAFDLDNMARTLQRQTYHATTPDYALASADAATSTWLRGVERQIADVGDQRLYVTLGQLIPGGNVGDPERYSVGERVEVSFLNRDGSKLVGNVWPCISGAACPTVVITTGSIQVTQHMYGWAARTLQAADYTVFTYDVRGQGESETTVHPFGGSTALANPQDEANFVHGTVDALDFVLSTEAAPYVPHGWTGADFEATMAASGGDPLARFNPIAEVVDPTRLAIAGHSLGATAVSEVQQCSDAYGAAPDAAPCDGATYPIRAVVGWDGLRSDVIPAVPALNHTADGYFVNAVPTPAAPPVDGNLGAFATWRDAGVDVLSLTVRGGTHAEFSQIPAIVSATCYGVPQASYYLLAWMNRYVHPGRAAAGTAAVLEGPVPDEPAGSHRPWRASLMSGKYTSAFAFHGADGAPHVADDIRAYAGVAAVGDWAAVNAEAEGLDNPGCEQGGALS